MWDSPANIRLDEDVFKTSWSRRICSPQPYVFRRRLQDVLVKTNIFVLAICLQDVFKTSSRPLQGVFKTSSRRLDQDEYVCLSLTSSEDVFKTSSRRLGQDQYIRLGYTSSRRLQDVFKTSSRCLQDIFKTSCKDIFKTFSRRTIKLICSS